MKVTSKTKTPRVDMKQAERILKAAKEYPVVKEKIDQKIAYALKSKSLSEKNEILREIRLML